MHVLRSLRPSWLLLSLVAFVSVSCVDDDEPTTPQLDDQFVGYTDPNTQQTTCGNCHITKQRTWVTTAHARAVADLEAAGTVQSFCYDCHTVNGYSNNAPDSAGYTSVAGNAKDFYKDVQCESCHGPGAGHVSAPDDAQPLSTIKADTLATWGCATCHRDTHHPFVEEWQASAHAHVQSGAVGNASCIGCHSGQGALARFDPEAKYVERLSSTWEPTTCAVCHDPHGTDNPADLRLPVSTPSIETNLCMQCHNRRSVPDPTSSRGPHAPQGPMVLGEAGYIPPNFAYDATQQATSHGNESNPGLCATCHMERFTVSDAVTGAFVINATGHSFKAIPCVDVNGQPTGAANCPDAERRFNACASGGCHSTGAVAMSARQILEGRLQGYIDVLWKDKDADGVLDPLPIDSGLLAQVRLTTPGDFSTTGAGATVITVGEGTWFNVDMIQRGDGSFGVHNPFYAEALLLGSTAALRAQYTYLPAPPAYERTRMTQLGMQRMLRR